MRDRRRARATHPSWSARRRTASRRRHSLGRYRAKLGSDRQDLVGLWIQGKHLRPRRRGNRLLNGEAGGRILLRYRECAITLRAEGLHRRQVEGSAVGAVANGEISDDMPVRSRQNDHVLIVAARGEEDIVLRVQRKAGASSTLARNIVPAKHFHRVRVDDRDARLVFDVDIDLSVAVGDSLLGCATDVDGAEDRAILIVEDGNIRLSVAEDVEVVIVRVV